MDGTLQVSGDAQRRQHVLGVVAGGAVHAQPDRQAALQHRRDRGHPAAETHVRQWTVRHRHLPGGEGALAGVVELDAVDGEHAVPQEAVAVEVVDGPEAGVLPAHRFVGAGLEQVDGDR